MYHTYIVMELLYCDRTRVTNKQDSGVEAKNTCVYSIGLANLLPLHRVWARVTARQQHARATYRCLFAPTVPVIPTW